MQKILVKSSKINQLNKGMKRAQNFQQGLKMSIETAKYGNLIHDPYRNVYYRFAFQDTPLEADEDLQVASVFRKNFSIIILNKDYKVIGEYFSPNNLYLPSLFFVAKDGLYISSNHVKNPDFSEDRLVFKRFTLTQVISSEKRNPKEVQLLDNKLIENKSDTTIYTHVDKYPELLNLDELIKIKKHKEWPAHDQRRVACSAIVETDGTISNISLEKGDDTELNEETIRLFKMAKFEPAQMKDGNRVRCRTVFLMRYP